MKLAINGGGKAAGSLSVPAWPRADEADRTAVMQALDGGRWCRLYPGSRAEAFEQEFAAFQDARFGVAVANGTVALELALLACGVRPGDEVLVPAVTFIASASAIVRVGAVPIFVDSHPQTVALDPASVEGAITFRTRAVVAVHYGGYPVDFDALLPLCRRHGLTLIEDCAHAQGSAWKGKGVGALGSAGAFSFQESKSLSAGEGGVVLTDDEEIAERARLLHNIGRAVGRPGYEHQVLASNFRMSELHAALLSSQLGKLPAQLERREGNARRLRDLVAQIDGLEALPRDERITARGYYFFVLRYHHAAFGDVPRDVFLRALRAEGVGAGDGYAVPLYRQPCFLPDRVAACYAPGTRLPAYHELRLPAAERFCREEQVTLPQPLLLLPEGQFEQVLEAFRKIAEHREELQTAARVVA